MSRLVDGGQCGSLARSINWSSTSLGEMVEWPLSLTASMNLMLNSRQPMFLAWGPDLTFIYNDGYVPILGSRHPWAMGQSFKMVWPEIWQDIWPLIKRALSGNATWMENMHLVMERNGAPETPGTLFPIPRPLMIPARSVG